MFTIIGLTLLALVVLVLMLWLAAKMCDGDAFHFFFCWQAIGALGKVLGCLIGAIGDAIGRK